MQYIDEKEMANIVYDTLFANTQWKQFSELDEGIENQEIGSNQIVFRYNGKNYTITVEEEN